MIVTVLTLPSLLLGLFGAAEPAPAVPPPQPTAVVRPAKSPVPVVVVSTTDARYQTVANVQEREKVVPIVTVVVATPTPVAARVKVDSRPKAARQYPTNAEVGIIRPVNTPTPDSYSGQKLGAAVPARIARWEDEILAAAQKYDIDPNLIAALMNTESAGNPNAKSGANAIGLLQVIGGPRDPEENVLQGTKMLVHNLRLFDEDLELALAAYNAGPRNVLRYKGIPPFAETKAHIQRTIGAYERFKASA